jgi:hypothetical protein
MKLTRDKLFMLHPDAEDPKYPGRRFYCEHCAILEGVLTYFPELTKKIDIQRVNWPRPRAEVVALVGENNQGLPLLILANGETSQHQTGVFEGRAFVSDKDAILKVLAERHGIAEPHP